MATNSEASDSIAKSQPVRGNDRCLHELFAEQAHLYPDRVAVIFENKEITYAVLNQQADELAQQLTRAGAQLETPIGILMERSVDMIVGLLAVLKAGGAYLPIDPAYPAERIAFMLEDSRAHIVLTQCALRPSLPAMDATVICLDESATKGVSESVLLARASPENLAYIIYTSGSTGRPKGVMIEHRGLTNLAETQTAIFDVRPESRVLQFASLSFDASISEIAMTWQAGAAMCLATRDSLLPGPGLIDLLRRQEITHVTLPPSILAAMPDAELPMLTTIITAGESCSAEIVARWAPGRRFFNAYGPTETTVCATIGECRMGESRPPIGSAIQNTEVLLLDVEGCRVPVGSTGEIHVGGIGLARGYLNQPTLTAEKFIPHPFSSEPHARLYRTGDLARALPDGRLEFLGRIDHQVKIRGYRIELGEIEATLSRHPAVQHAAVLARDSGAGDKRLVAYVVPADREACSADALRAFCRRHLPDYMVPSAFVRMNSFPLTVNGKIDREALPEPAYEKSPNFVSPGTRLEQQIAAIWSDVIKFGEVGAQDNFFEIGGDSLKLAEVHGRLSRELGYNLPVIALFQHPTVSLLAKFLQSKSSTNSAVSGGATARAMRQKQAMLRTRSNLKFRK